MKSEVFPHCLINLLIPPLVENINGIPFNLLFKSMQSYRQLEYRDLELLTNFSEHAASMIDIWTKKQVLQQNPRKMYNLNNTNG